MKNQNFSIIVIAILVASLTGCSTSKQTAFNKGFIQKRKYNKGFHLKAFNQKKNRDSDSKSTKSNPILTESFKENFYLTQVEDKKTTTNDLLENFQQSEILSVISPKRSSRMVTSNASNKKVNRIIGEKAFTVFSENEGLILKNRINSSWETVSSNADDLPGAGTSSSGKSQLVALLLCIFIGIIGIHRFYLGYTTIGVIQLLTLGGCGIWTLIDLIMIITGDLTPANESYSETL